MINEIILTCNGQGNMTEVMAQSSVVKGVPQQQWVMVMDKHVDNVAVAQQ